MRKLIAAINMTIDGYCDHTAITPDEAIHQHYADLLKNAGVALYGRITFQLMQYWQTVLSKPTGIKATDDFAVAIDKVPKIVFSQSLKNTGWETAKLASHDLEKEVIPLKQQPGKSIFACSPSLIVELTNLNLIDEYQLCIHPVIAGGGLPLFKNLHEKVNLRLLKTKNFDSGAIIHYYQPLKKR